MMKKKINNSKDKTSTDQNKTPDYKEYSPYSENNNENNKSDSDSVHSNESSSNSGNNEGTSDDKVVAGIRAVEEKLAEMQDRYIRLSAEFDNYRKRTLREKMELSKYAGEDLLVKIIPIMDDFERALAHMNDATDCIAMKSGIDLIYGKFSEFLKQSGIKEIDSINIPFNVDLHEAVAKVPVEEDTKKGIVVDVVQKGYYLQDKVLRFSKVVVGE
jgi:molecular chaperone GrpE